MEKQTSPKIIYHYTTQDGLIGILKYRALWATKIHYLNDASELIEPLRIAENELEILARQFHAEGMKNDQLTKDIYDRMLYDIQSWKSINIYVASFCTQGDLLSQWRGYGVPSSAYAIGFDSQKLVQTISQYSFELRKCQYYNSMAYRKEITQLIMEYVNEVKTNNETPVDFIGKLVNRAATMKFECFIEEDEWRIVSWRPLSYIDNNINFRLGKSVVIPYYSMPLDLSSIVEIMVGPCQHPELAKDAIYGLAHKFDLKKIQVGGIKTSQIPYRIF